MVGADNKIKAHAAKVLAEKLSPWVGKKPEELQSAWGLPRAERENDVLEYFIEVEPPEGVTGPVHVLVWVEVKDGIIRRVWMPLTEEPL